MDKYKADVYNYKEGRMTGRRIYQKIFGLIAALFLGILICPNNAKAATVSDFNELKNGFKVSVTYSKMDKKEGHYFFMKGMDMADEAKVTKVALKKKALGTVKVKKYGFRFYPKKTGKTAVTITAVIDGKKVKYTGTITVKKFRQPFKKLTIGGKNYRKKIVRGRSFIDLASAKKKTIQYKLNRGWKVVKMYDYDNERIKPRTKFEVSKIAYGSVTMCLRYKDGTQVVVDFSDWSSF